jgi:hypothetical protein
VCLCLYAAVRLQVEQLDEVERAFVHVDYMRRDGLEHKVSVGGLLGVRGGAGHLAACLAASVL